MEDFGIDRRRFLRGAGRALIASGAVSAAGLSASSVLAAGPGALTQTPESQAAITPASGLRMLAEGNTRFVRGEMLERDLMGDVAATATGQFPFAAIVGCIDSRVSSELIFDQGIGDIFGVRIAGNFVNDDMLGSLEYACAVAGARLVVVVGHTDCGAIKGACDDVVLGNLTQTLANLKPAVAAVPGFQSDRTSSNKAFVQAVADKNVALTVDRIRQRSPILRDLADKGAIAIAGAMYNVRTGWVAFTPGQ